MYSYRDGDAREFDPLHQNGIQSDVDQPIASCYFEPTSDYL
jgi:hypothetical protein